MIKLFRNFEKKDYLLFLVVAFLVVFSVFFFFITPEYMSKITMLVQTEDSTMKEISYACMCCR